MCITKYWKRAIYGELRRYLWEVLRRLARQRESEVEEGHLLADHVHMLLSIPPKHAVADVVGYIKGKSAIHTSQVSGNMAAPAPAVHQGIRRVPTCRRGHAIGVGVRWWRRLYHRIQQRTSPVHGERQILDAGLLIFPRTNKPAAGSWPCELAAARDLGSLRCFRSRPDHKP